MTKMTFICPQIHALSFSHILIITRSHSTPYVTNTSPIATTQAFFVFLLLSPPPIFETCLVSLFPYIWSLLQAKI